MRTLCTGRTPLASQATSTVGFSVSVANFGGMAARLHRAAASSGNPCMQALTNVKLRPAALRGGQGDRIGFGARGQKGAGHGRHQGHRPQHRRASGAGGRRGRDLRPHAGRGFCHCRTPARHGRAGDRARGRRHRRPGAEGVGHGGGAGTWRPRHRGAERQRAGHFQRRRRLARRVRDRHDGHGPRRRGRAAVPARIRPRARSS